MKRAGASPLSALLLACILLSTAPALAAVYVKWDSPGPPDGASWNTAYHTIQQGVDASEGTAQEVWVARGTYSGGVNLKDGVMAYGGFAGTETLRSQRDPTSNPTIVGTGTAGNGVNCADSSGIDGFTVRGQSGFVANSVYQPVVENCLFENVSGAAVSATFCTSLRMNDNTFTNGLGRAADIHGCSGSLSFQGNTWSGNAGGGIYVSNCSLSEGSLWQAQPSLPYVIEYGLSVGDGAGLTIAAGSVVKFVYGAGLTCLGSLIAQGTPGNPIHFTSLQDDTIGGDTNGDGPSTFPVPGDWAEVVVNGTGLLSYCDLKYGGSNTQSLIRCGGTSASIDHCTLSDSFYGAVSVGGTGSYQITSNQISDCWGEGIQVLSATAPAVTGNTVARCGGYGIYLYSCTSPAVTENSVTDCNSHAVHMDYCSGELSFSGNSGSGNWGNGVYAANCSVTESSRWQPQSLFPCVISGSLPIAENATLTVDPGSVVKLGPNGSMSAAGGLSAIGTSGLPIHFTSIKDDSVGGDTNGDGANSLPAPGNWGAIQLSGLASSGQLAHCTMTYGGYGPAVLSCDQGSFSATDCTVAKSWSGGIRLNAAGGARVERCVVAYCDGTGAYLSDCTGPRIVECTISNCEGYGLHLQGCASPVVDENTFSATNSWAACLTTCTGDLSCGVNSGSGCKGNGLYLDGCTADLSSRWEPAPGFPYVVGSVLSIGADSALTIEPGVVVKLQSTASGIGCSGQLDAIGTAGSPIHITSVKDDTIAGDTNGDGGNTKPAAGNWAGVWCSGAGSAANLSYCVARYGGTAGGAILSCKAGGVLKAAHCTVSDSADTGVWLHEASHPELSDSTVSKCNRYGAYVTNCTSPRLSGNTLSLNGDWAATVASCTGEVSLSANSGSQNRFDGVQLGALSISANSAWGPTTDLPYVIRQLVQVSDGVRLAVEPGAVAKLEGWGVSGGDIHAVGTQEQPIYFTSFRDDTVGGDTFNDGSETVPAAGDWSGIQASGAASGVTLGYCVIRYGGAVGEMIRADGGAPLSLTNCTVARSGSTGVVSTSAATSVRNCIIAANAGNGLQLTGDPSSVSYSDLWSNAGNSLVSAVQTEVSYADPAFVSLAAGDYRLRPESSCIDSGDPALLDADGSVSDRGAVRPWPCVSFAKTRADGVQVQVVHSTVICATNTYGGFAYVEDWDRTSGIRVATSAELAVGDSVELRGTISTVSGERVVTAQPADVLKLGGRPVPAALGMANRHVGGGDWHYVPATGAGQKGITGAAGPNNIGLLVRSWGHVVDRGTDWLAIDDGSGVSLRVLFPAGVIPPELGNRAIVCGIGTCQQSGQDLLRCILVRGASDIVTY